MMPISLSRRNMSRQMRIAPLFAPHRKRYLTRGDRWTAEPMGGGGGRLKRSTLVAQVWSAIAGCPAVIASLSRGTGEVRCATE